MVFLIKRTKDFEKSFRKISRSGLSLKAREKLEFVIDSLACERKLDIKYKNHRLKGELKDYCECHIVPDLLLIYKIEEEENVLILVDIGSHNQLFG